MTESTQIEHNSEKKQIQENAAKQNDPGSVASKTLGHENEVGCRAHTGPVGDYELELNF